MKILDPLMSIINTPGGTALFAIVTILLAVVVDIIIYYCVSNEDKAEKICIVVPFIIFWFCIAIMICFSGVAEYQKLYADLSNQVDSVQEIAHKESITLDDMRQWAAYEDGIQKLKDENSKYASLAAIITLPTAEEVNALPSFVGAGS